MAGAGTDQGQRGDGTESLHEELTELVGAEAKRAAHFKALDLLSRREHSRWELARKLGQRNFDPVLVEEVIAELTERGLLSDERFAEAFTRQRIARGYGPVRIEHDLRERGVDVSVIATVIADDDATWGERARERMRRRFSDAPPVDRGEEAKRVRYLVSQGYAFHHARAVAKG